MPRKPEPPRAQLRAGLASRARTISRAEEKRERVRELRSQGLSIRAIANETGYSVSTVHRYVKEAQDA